MYSIKEIKKIIDEAIFEEIYSIGDNFKKEV